MEGSEWGEKKRGAGCFISNIILTMDMRRLLGAIAQELNLLVVRRIAINSRLGYAY